MNSAAIETSQVTPMARKSYMWDYFMIYVIYNQLVMVVRIPIYNCWAMNCKKSAWDLSVTAACRLKLQPRAVCQISLEPPRRPGATDFDLPLGVPYSQTGRSWQIHIFETCSPQPGRCSTLTIVMITIIIMIIIITIITIIILLICIFMRGQNLPPTLNNMLIGVKTSTISPWGIKMCHPLWALCWLG